jgi:hypothetical protein
MHSCVEKSYSQKKKERKEKKGLVEWLEWQEHLPSMHEALSLNSSAIEKKKKSRNL